MGTEGKDKKYYRVGLFIIFLDTVIIILTKLNEIKTLIINLIH
jgi:hypothetical protein